MISLIVIVGLGLSVIVTFTTRERVRPLDLATAEMILRASVKIQIVSPVLDDRGNPFIVEDGTGRRPLNAISSGLGTIVTSNGTSYVITHDHYAQIDAPYGDVDITDINGKTISVDILDLRRSIRYRNNGVIVFLAPKGLSIGGSPGMGDGVPPGSHVHVVYRHAETDGLSVVSAVVEKWTDQQGIPSFKLRMLNGEAIDKGNSGGGVWFEGRLIGSLSRGIFIVKPNRWRTATEPELEPTDTCYATALSPERMPLLFHNQ
jgi:hypothetical protein